MLENARKVIQAAQSTPPAPEVLRELTTMLSDDSATLGDFEKTLSGDAELAKTLILLSNATYFGVRQEIGSVRQAIAYLGRDRVFELGVCAWLCTRLPYRIPGYDISAKSLWLHSGHRREIFWRRLPLP